MKDAEFIELLNLYLDHEISAEDSARLEAEVLSSPRRRRTYHEYCRMQKACAALADEAATEVALPDRTLVAFEPAPTRGWGLGAYATGLCAAAACVAFLFVARDRSTSPFPQTVQIAGTTAEQPLAVLQEPVAARAIARTVSVTPRKSTDLKPVFTAYRSLTETNSRSPSFAAAHDARFDWLNDVQISALGRPPVEDLVFRVNSSGPLGTGALSDRRPVDETIERAAWQFQR